MQNNTCFGSGHGFYTSRTLFCDFEEWLWVVRRNGKRKYIIAFARALIKRQRQDIFLLQHDESCVNLENGELARDVN